MVTHRTTARKGSKGGFRVRLFLILAIISVVAGIISWIWYNQGSSNNDGVVEPRDVVQTATVDPTPTNRPIKLAAEIPSQLTDEQRFGLWVVEQVLDDPQRWVGEPKIEMSENDRQVFIALILTESSFHQFDEDGETLDSGIDCDGLAQLCNNPEVCHPDTRWNPFENVYCGARYFKELVEKWSGDYGKALAEYKGASDPLPSGERKLNPDHAAVTSVFDYLSLR